MFLSDFFLGETFAKENIKTQFIFTTCWQKMANRNLFLFWKNQQKKRIQRRGFNNREHKQRVSFFCKEKKILRSEFSKVFSTL